MNDSPSITKFAAFVQLKDFRAPTKKEYVRYVRRLGDHYQCDPARLLLVFSISNSATEKQKIQPAQSQ